MSALLIAAAGMNAAATRFERNANITRAGAGTPEGQGVDIGAEMVDMMINQNQFSVLASVAKRAGDMMKTGIDIPLEKPSPGWRRGCTVPSTAFGGPPPPSQGMTPTSPHPTNVP